MPVLCYGVGLRVCVVSGSLLEFSVIMLMAQLTSVFFSFSFSLCPAYLLARRQTLASAVLHLKGERYLHALPLP